MSISVDDAQSTELLWIVDEADEVIGQATRTEVHARRSWHRQSYVLLFNFRGDLLIQKRSSDRKFDPNKWTTSVSGHVIGGDSYLISAQRETLEELGIELGNLKYLGKVLAFSEAAGEICGGPSAVYTIVEDIPVQAFNRQEAEIEKVAYVDPRRIRRAIDGLEILVLEDEIIHFAEDFAPVFDLFWNIQNEVTEI